MPVAAQPSLALLQGSALLPDGQVKPGTTWKWFWPVLAIALVARLATAVIAPVPLHPDETFQYLEQAYRLVYGYGLIPWEYVYGIRSWMLPLSVAGILELGRTIGLEQPWQYIPLVQTVFSALSLTLPVAMYRLAQSVLPERGAIIAFLFGCFWLHFLYLAHKPVPGILATYALLWVCVLLLRPPETYRLMAIGLLAGLVLVLRYQLAPVIGVLAVYTLWRLRWNAWPALASGLMIIVVAGIVDQWFWGGFLFSFRENFRLNFEADIATHFGPEGPAYYLLGLIRETWGLAIPAALGVLMLLRPVWPIILAMAVGVAAFHIPAHKEFRFIVWVLPFIFLALSATVLAVEERLVRRNAAAVSGVIVLAIWSLAATGTSLWRLTGQADTESRHSAAAHTVFQALARETDVTGVTLLAPHLRWWRTPGYYGLGKPVPIYFPDWHATADADPGDELHQVSHIVTVRDVSAPEGFSLLTSVGDYSIWRADSPQTRPCFARYDVFLPLTGQPLRGIPPNPGLEIRPRLPQSHGEGGIGSGATQYWKVPADDAD